MNVIEKDVLDKISSDFEYIDLNFLYSNLDNFEDREIPFYGFELKNDVIRALVIIKDNTLTEIPEIITHLEHLEELVIISTKVKEFPPFMKKMGQLRTLILKRNSLYGNLEFDFSSFPKLKELDLSFNRLTKFPNVFNNKELEKLYLNINKITEIDQSIEKLTSLQELELSGNRKIKELPENMKNLLLLKSLNIVENQLKMIPDFISKLKSLKHFYISNNPLTSISDNIYQLNLLTLSLSELNNYNLHNFLKPFHNLEHLILNEFNFSNCELDLTDLGNLKKISLMNLTPDTLNYVSLPPNILDFEVFKNDLKQFDFKSLHQLKFLKIFTLIYSNLSEFESNLPTSVEKIDLSNNKLKVFRIPNLEALSQLKEVNLQSNSLERLSDLRFPTSIEKLNVKYNSLKSFIILNPEMLDLIEELDFQGSKLKQIPLCICNIPNLRKVDFSGNPISNIPSEIKHLTKLRELNLNNTNLTALPEEIGALCGLQKLYLRNTSIKSLPKSILNLKQLEIFQLSHTELTEFPEELCQLSNLKTVVIHHHKFKTLPTTIGNLTQIKHLSLSEGNLKTLPETIGNFKQLEFLNLELNPMDTFQPA